MNKEDLNDYLSKVDEKYNSANLLFNTAAYNDSVSRAYYAVFHIMSAVLLSKDLTFSSHKEVIGNFVKEFIKTNIFPQEFTKKIYILFNAMQIGDYNIMQQIDKDKAVEELQYAREIIGACKEYLYQN